MNSLERINFEVNSKRNYNTPSMSSPFSPLTP
jgi:hypothetical protein